MLMKSFRVLLCASLAFSCSLSNPLQARSAGATPIGAVVPVHGINGEACPARVGHWKIHPGGVVAFNLAAHQTRSLSATIELRTDKGFYTIAVPATDLVARQQHWKTLEVAWTGTAVQSAPLYFHMPTGSTKLRDIWVAGAQALTPSDPWYSVGPVACAPYAGAFGTVSQIAYSNGGTIADPMHLKNPDRSLAAAIPSTATLLTAQSIPAPTYSCAHPFVPAKLVHGVNPLWPLSAPTMHFKSAVIVTILPTGEIGARHVYLPTGIRDLDSAVLDAAGESTFTPAVAFCKPAYGRYIFRVDLNPGAVRVIPYNSYN